MRSVLQGLSKRSYTTKSVFCSSTITSKLPQVKLCSSTTLGEIWDAAFVKYKYRMAYPALLWAGFLYYNLWVPYFSFSFLTLSSYMPEAEKKALKAKEDYLTSLEFHQE